MNKILVVNDDKFISPKSVSAGIVSAGNSATFQRSFVMAIHYDNATVSQILVELKKPGKVYMSTLNRYDPICIQVVKSDLKDALKDHDKSAKSGYSLLRKGKTVWLDMSHND